MMMIKLVKSGSNVEEYVNARYIARFKVNKDKGVTEVEFTKDSGLTNISVSETPDEILGLMGGQTKDISSKKDFSSSSTETTQETPSHHDSNAQAPVHDNAQANLTNTAQETPDTKKTNGTSRVKKL